MNKEQLKFRFWIGVMLMLGIINFVAYLIVIYKEWFV